MAIRADISKTGDADHICNSCKHKDYCWKIVMHYGKLFDCDTYEMLPDFEVSPRCQYVVVVGKDFYPTSVYGPFATRAKAQTAYGHIVNSRAHRGDLTNAFVVIRKVRKY